MIESPAKIITSHRRDAMKISARNVLKGKVKAVKLGVVNAEVTVQLPGKIELVSVITKESAQTLKLKEGSEVYAVVKASSVMIAVD
jgi:molybdopterin-binding protein